MEDVFVKTKSKNGTKSADEIDATFLLSQYDNLIALFIEKLNIIVENRIPVYHVVQLPV